MTLDRTEAVLEPTDFSDLPGPTICFVDRPRLNARLNDLVEGDRRIVSLWAAAGCGKTSLLAHWATQLRVRGHRVIWLTAHDVADRTTVVDEVVAELRPASENHDPLPQVFVFIDDIHRFSSDTRAEAYRMLAALPPHLRMVMAGRYQPFASLAFLEASAVMTELRTPDFAFNQDEARQLASYHGIELSDESVRTLVGHTGGWATALALAMPWLRDTANPKDAIEAFGGDSRAVADYLVTEVLRGLQNPERSVLMTAAVREFVPLELAIVLTGRNDTGEVLHRLARRNTLLSEENGGYRYHPVLLAYLQAESRRQDNSRAMRGHIAAAGWYGDSDDGLNAVEHALAANDSATVADMLERFGLELVLSGHTDLLAGAQWKFPQSEDPLAAIVIRLVMEAPHYTDSRRARHLFAMAGKYVGETSMATQWELALVALQCFAPASEAVTRARLDQLSTPEAIRTREEHMPLDLLAATAEGWCLNRNGDREAAADVFQGVATASQRAGYHWLHLLAADAATIIATVSGDWAHVAELEDQMVRSAQSAPVSRRSRVGGGATVVMAARAYQRCKPMPLEQLDRIITSDTLGIDLGLIVPARILRVLPTLDSDANPRSALEDVERMLRDAGHRFPRLVAAAALRVTSMRLALDGRERARESVELVRSVLGHDSLEALTSRFVLNIPTHIGDAAEHELEEAVRSPASAWHAGAAIGGWILLAQLAQDTRRHNEADSRIIRAVRLADESRIARPFLARNGEGVTLVASRIGRFGHLDAFARHIVERGNENRPPHAKRSHSVEPLTPREREILLELPVHQSVAEIARKHSLSINTVKTHLRNIYQKLAAPDRSHAVTIAQDHGLL